MRLCFRFLALLEIAKTLFYRNRFHDSFTPSNNLVDGLRRAEVSIPIRMLTYDWFSRPALAPAKFTLQYAESSGIEPHTPKGTNCLAGSRYHRLALLSKCAESRGIDPHTFHSTNRFPTGPPHHQGLLSKISRYKYAW